MNIGNNIRNIRKEKGMTLQQIANIMGCSPQLISQYETGKRIPKNEQIQKIATALGCFSSDILYGFETEIHISTTSKERTSRNNTVLPGSIVLDITKENYDKYSKYFNAGFLYIKDIICEVKVISAETGKILNKEELEKKYDSLSIEDKLTIFQEMVDRFAINPIFDTINIDMFLPPEPPQE